MRTNPLVSVCIPTYNSEKIIPATLESLKNQSYRNFEVVVSDDASKDGTVKLIRSYGFKRLRIQRNKSNLGYGENLQQLEKRPRGDIIFLLAHDDVIVNDGIQRSVEGFLLDPKVGVVTRPYYWFDTDVDKPVRHIPPADKTKDVVIDIQKNPEKIIPIIESVGQLSGLAYRRDLFTHFHHEVFPAHIYPFMDILKIAKCVFLKDYTIAVGIRASQTRFKPSIYDISPTESWMKMFETVFAGEKFRRVGEIAKDHMAQNYLGLIQLKNYGKNPGVLYREIAVLVKFRWKNIFSPAFWFFSLGTVFIPRAVLRWLVDKYKKQFLSQGVVEIVKQ
jgi:glycosyltransferase involved in cell wall biosynthesis